MQSRMTAPPPHTQNQSENSRSIQLARKHCDNPSWIYIDTTPFYAMVRFSGGRLKHIENTTYQNMHLYSHLKIHYKLSSIIAGTALGLALSLPPFLPLLPPSASRRFAILGLHPHEDQISSIISSSLSTNPLPYCTVTFLTLGMQLFFLHKMRSYEVTFI